jgi:Zn-dependent membrane protease YugP
MIFSSTWLLLALPGILLGLWAQSRVKSNFNKYAKVRTLRNVTGSQVARDLLDAQGLYDVAVEETQGMLTDHYDPRTRVLRLSPEVYRTPSVAAAGIAAHEMGHALQHAKGYAPLQLRSTLVPATQFGSNLAPMIFMGGFLLQWLGVTSLAMNIMAGIRAVETGRLAPVAGTTTLDPEIRFDVALHEPRPVDVDLLQVNSFGFGGQNASVVIGRDPSGR